MTNQFFIKKIDMYNHFILTLSLFFFFSLDSLTAQNNDSNRNINDIKNSFIYFKDGKMLVEGEYLIKERFLFGEPIELLNGERINTNDLKFIQKNESLFANLKDEFSFCVERGRFNIYTKINPRRGSFTSEGKYIYTGATKGYFYSEGFNDLKPLRYNNLSKRA